MIARLYQIYCLAPDSDCGSSESECGVLLDYVADIWNLLAENITDITLFKIDSIPKKQFLTYKNTGEAAPADNDKSNALLLAAKNKFSFSDPVDLYFQPSGQGAQLSVFE